MNQPLFSSNKIKQVTNLLLVIALLFVTAVTYLPVSAANSVDDHGGFHLEDLKPEKALVNSPDITLSLKGRGFVAGAVVLWDGVKELTPTSITEKSIQVLVTADMLTAVGVFHVSVKNPDGAISNSESFRVVLAPMFKPMISRLNPNKVNVETGAAGTTFELKIFGKNFIPAAVINWYDPITLLTTALTKVGDCLPKLCTVTVDKGLIAQKNEVKITVTNGTVVSKPKSLKIVFPKPILTSMDPSTAAAGSPLITLNLVGDLFQADSIVRWEEHALPGPIIFTDAQHISVEVPASYLVKAGEFDVDVVNPGTGHSRELEFHVTGGVNTEEH
jgi:hypothetical protein